MRLMIDQVKLSEKELNDFHEKSTSLDPRKFKLEKLTSSGRHAFDVTEEVI